MQAIFTKRWIRQIAGVVLISTYAGNVVTSAFGATTEEIKTRAFETLSTVKSSRFDVRLSNSVGASSEIITIRSGKKYRIERRDKTAYQLKDEEGNPLPLMNSAWAFDGSQYQTLDKSADVLKTSDAKHTTGAVDPLLRPYSWLTASLCKRLEWEEVLNADTWKTRFADCRHIGQGVFQGAPCEIVEFP